MNTPFGSKTVYYLMEDHQNQERPAWGLDPTFLNDKEYVLHRLKRNPAAWFYCDVSLKNDRDFLIRAVQTDPAIFSLKNLSSKYFYEEEFFFRCHI